MKLSPNAVGIKYAIRDVVQTAKEVEKQGKKLYYFNIGDPNKYDFDTPKFLKKALVEAIMDDKANYYTESAGAIKLRDAIVKREKRLWGTDLESSKILVTSGVSEAIAFIAASLAPGSEILIPSPLYPPYNSYFKFYGVATVEYSTMESDGWQPNVDSVRNKISPKTQAIVIINPNNPTGAVYSPDIVKKITDIAGEHNLLVISDEIYDLFHYRTSCYSDSSSFVVEHEISLSRNSIGGDSVGSVICSDLYSVGEKIPHIGIGRYDW